MPDPAPPTDAELDAMLERADSSSVGLGESLRDVLQREDSEFVAAAGDDIPRLVAEVRRLRRGGFTDAELRAMARVLPVERFRVLEREAEGWRKKLYGFAKPDDEAERAELKAHYAGQTEPCCECWEEYPRGELVIDGEIYCAKCRAKAAPEA
jgi:hypothetical protein